MKILLQFELSSKIVELDNGENIHKLVERIYNLSQNSYCIKKFDKEFEEYVDFCDLNSISDKDKFKIVKIASTSVNPSTPNNSAFDIPSTSEFSAFLSDDTHTQNGNLAVEIVLNLKNKSWPTKIVIPFGDFSKPLKVALDQKKELNWELSKELIGHLANYAYQYHKYPSKLQRQQICLSLVESFPHLKNDFGLGIESFEIKLNNKLKRLRQNDNSLEVTTVRKASILQEYKTPKKLKKEQVKGALNWAPDHFPAEDDNSQAHHNEILKDECAKDEKQQDKFKIKNLMALTYSFRRVDINNKISVNNLLVKCPIFFQVTEQLDEFVRLTSIDIDKVFIMNAIRKGTKLLQLFRMKKLNDEQKDFLKKVDLYLNDIDVIQRRCEAETAYGIMILPFLFKEPMDSFFQLVSFKFYLNAKT